MALKSKGLPRSIPDVYERLEALEAAVGAPYTDAKARDAIKTKTQINALSAASTAADIVAALKA